MINFHVELDESYYVVSKDFARIRDKSSLILKAAINNTAKQTMTLLVDEANKEYQISQPSKIKKTLTLDKATVRNLTATITSRGRVNELYNFMVKPRTYIRGGGVPGGYGAHTKRGADYKNIFLKQNAGNGDDKYRAFVVKYKSGHRTIAQRRPDRKMKSDPSKEFLKTLFAPSIPNILGDEQGVYGVVEPRMRSMLQQNIDTQVQKFLGGSS